MMTMALAVNSAGWSTPPFFLFPRQNMQSAFMNDTSSGAVGFANSFGLMQQAEFVKYIEFFIRFNHTSKERPTLLLLDNYASYLSVEALYMAAENGLALFSFPPHCLAIVYNR